MCGLVGVAGDIYGNWKDVFTELLLIDVVRGPHSTGSGFVGRHKEDFETLKVLGHPFNLFGTKDFEKAMDNIHLTKVIMGHNRYATVGAKSEANAHPFMFEHVIGVHNGTLDKFSDLDEKKFGTDSEAIFASINDIGVEATIAQMSGAWALIWFDRRDHTLNMLNNGKRPLHYCYSEDRCTLIWASELEMLRYVMLRKGKKVSRGDKGQEQYFTPDKDVLYSWVVPNSINTKFAVPDQIKIEGKAPPVYASFKHGTNYHYTTGNSSDSVVPFAMRKTTAKFRPPYKDVYGRVVTKKEFEPMVMDGCAFCGDFGQKWGEFIQIMGRYDGKFTPYMCEGCYNDGEFYDYTQYAV